MEPSTCDAIDRAIEHVLLNEGGFVDHPDDPGGATNWGITERRARDAGYTGDMRDMTREWALAFYRSEEVFAPGYGPLFEISETLGTEVLDSAVNCGAPTASRWLQESLNALNRDGLPDLITDGKCGDKTIARARLLPPNDILRLIKLVDSLQGAHYVSISNSNRRLRAFTRGWAAKRLR